MAEADAVTQGRANQQKLTAEQAAGYLRQISSADQRLNAFFTQHFTDDQWKEPGPPNPYTLTEDEKQLFTLTTETIPSMPYWMHKYPITQNGKIDTTIDNYVLDVWDNRPGSSQDSYQKASSLEKLHTFLMHSMDQVSLYAGAIAKGLEDELVQAKQQAKELEIEKRRAAIEKQRKVQEEVLERYDLLHTTQEKSQQQHQELRGKGIEDIPLNNLRGAARGFSFSGREFSEEPQVKQSQIDTILQADPSIAQLLNKDSSGELRKTLGKYVEEQAGALQLTSIHQKMKQVALDQTRKNLIAADLVSAADKFGERGVEIVELTYGWSSEEIRQLDGYIDLPIETLYQVHDRLMTEVSQDHTDDQTVFEASASDDKPPGGFGRVQQLLGMRKKVDQAQKLQMAAQVMKGLSAGQIGALAGTGAVVGAGALAGLIADGVTGATGVLASAGSGAAIGAVIGAPIAGVGALVGGIAGALIGTGIGVAGLFVPADVTLLGLHSSTATGALGNASLLPLNALTKAGGFISNLLGGTGAQVGAATASNAAQGVGGLASGLTPSAGTALGMGTQGLSAFLAGLSSGTSFSLATVASLVIGPLGIATGVTVFVIIPSIIGSFLIPGTNPAYENKYITLGKTPSQSYADDPIDITYTITIQAKQGYTITITDITDRFSVQSKQSPAPEAPTGYVTQLDTLIGKTSEPGTPVTIEYVVPFGGNPQYDNTRFTNTVTVSYTVSGEESTSDTFSANAAVTFGEPPASACWPTNGMVTQLPFSCTETSSGRICTHDNADAYDIAHDIPQPVIAPYGGRIRYYDETVNTAGNADYGRWAMLQADIGYTFIFAHMEQLNGPVGEWTRIEAGDQIGITGSTGNSTGRHLHYEIRDSSGNPLSPPSVLESLVPTKPSVGTQVSVGECGGGTTSEELTRVSCFVLSDQGDKPWTEEEKALATTTLQAVVSDPKRERAICTYNGSEQDIYLERSVNSCRDAGGPWGAMVQGASKITFCDNTFTDQTTFGSSTFWHEPGHILSNRNRQAKNFFPASVHQNEGFIPTYPYDLEAAENDITVRNARKIDEDFAESFGMCQKTKQEGPGYRKNGSITASDYPLHCTAIDSLLGSY